MPTRRVVEIFDLGLADVDAAAAFELLLKETGSSQGVLIEKDDAEERAAYIAAGPFQTIRVRRGKPTFRELGKRLNAIHVDSSYPFACGAVGWLGYEMAGHLERLPLRPEGEEGVLMLFSGWLVCNRRQGRVLWTGDRRLGARLAGGLRTLGVSREEPAPVIEPLKPMEGLSGRNSFLSGVRRLKEHIRAGDIFQAVLSERFEVPTKASPGAVYRALRRASPSPYLFWLRDGKADLLGASPERLVRVVEGRALNCPIAGTRPRSASPSRDRELERSLLRSPKERAEHFMLVDLARNDLGRVCAPGTVRVKEFMKVRRFPNVMHLVSEVEGRLDRGVSAWDAFAASFPAGTVSGAPKVRAMELLARLERRPRGFYAGALVQADFSGNLDSCISIRTMRLENGRAALQAGAGIVADSDPGREYQEVQNKLLGLRRALALAEAA